MYTTRTLEVAVSLTRGDVLELDAMNRQDATEFLLRSLVRKELLIDQATADKLLGELTCLPLAINSRGEILRRGKIWQLHGHH